MPFLAETSSSGAVFLLVLFTIIFSLLVIGLVIFLFVFWIMMLVDAIQRKDWASEDEKMMWIIVLAVSMFVGLWGIAALVYYFAIKKPRQDVVAVIAPTEAEVVKTSTTRSSARKATKAAKSSTKNKAGT